MIEYVIPSTVVITVAGHFYVRPFVHIVIDSCERYYLLGS